jgi:hypothetical protein
MARKSLVGNGGEGATAAAAGEGDAAAPVKGVQLEDKPMDFD